MGGPRSARKIIPLKDNGKQKGAERSGGRIACVRLVCSICWSVSSRTEEGTLKHLGVHCLTHIYLEQSGQSAGHKRDETVGMGKD